MTDLLYWLYTYATEHMTIDEPEYQENRAQGYRHYEALLEVLPPEQQELLSAFQEQWSEVAGAERRAIFCKGLGMGLSLGGLHQP